MKLNTLLPTLALAFSTACASGGVATNTSPEPESGGETIKARTIYVGRSPETGAQMFAATYDASEPMDYHMARNYCQNLLDGEGKGGFRLPSRRELDVLFDNRTQPQLRRTLKGTWGLVSGTHQDQPLNTYWSYSFAHNNFSWARNFANGNKNSHHWDDLLSVRCVR